MQTFLEVKIGGIARRMDGKMHPMEIEYGEYEPVNSLMVSQVSIPNCQGPRSRTT